MARKSFLSKFRSAEPAVFLYAFGLILHSILIQQYIYDRASEDKGYNNTFNSRTKCVNDSEVRDEVQSETSFYVFGLTAVSGAPSLVTGLLLGSWSDKVGRKPAMCLPCFGALVETSLTLLVVYFDLPLFVLFFGGFINGMTGYFSAMILATMAYIADTSDESTRATRVGILEFFVFIGGTVGQAMSGKIIESNQGYEAPYWIVCGCILAAFIHAVFLVPETLSKEHRDGSVKFFDWKHFQNVREVVRTRRNDDESNLRALIILNFFLFLSNYGVATVTILFLLDRPLCWSPLDIGLYCAERYFCLGVGAVLGVKILVKCFKIIHIIYFGLLTYSASLVLFAFADKTALVVPVPVLGMFIGAVMAFFRGAMSKEVSSAKQGSLFAAIGFMDVLAVVCSSAIFNLLYPLSLKFDFNGASFLAAGGLGLVVLYLTKNLTDGVFESSAKEIKPQEIRIEENTPLLSDIDQQPT